MSLKFPSDPIRRVQSFFFPEYIHRIVFKSSSRVLNSRLFSIPNFICFEFFHRNFMLQLTNNDNQSTPVLTLPHLSHSHPRSKSIAPGQARHGGIITPPRGFTLYEFAFKFQLPVLYRFYAMDHDPAVLLHADPDPAWVWCDWHPTVPTTWFLFPFLLNIF